MQVVVMDGQGGGIGAAVIRSLREALGNEFDLVEHRIVLEPFP